MKKKKLFVGIILVIISIIGAKLFLFTDKKIQGLKVKKADYIEKIISSGTIEGKENSVLSSGIDGTIEKIFLREGSFVKQGALIAKLDTKQIEAEIEKAKADLESSRNQLLKSDTLDLPNAQSAYDTALKNFEISKKEYEQYENLYNKKYITELDYNQKKTTLIQNQNFLENAKNQLNSIENGAVRKLSISNVNSSAHLLTSLENTLPKYYVYAPYDSYITERYVEVGDTVGPYTNLFSVSSIDEKIVNIDLDEKYVGRVAINDSIEIYPYYDSEKFTKGKIYFIGIDVSNLTGTIEVKGTLENDLKEFLYGGTVNVILQGHKIKDAILIPEKYLIKKSGKTFVLKQNGSSKKLVEVIGIPVIDGFVITSGLETEEVIVSPEEGEKY